MPVKQCQQQSPSTLLLLVLTASAWHCIDSQALPSFNEANAQQLAPATAANQNSQSSSSQSSSSSSSQGGSRKSSTTTCTNGVCTSTSDAGEGPGTSSAQSSRSCSGGVCTVCEDGVCREEPDTSASAVSPPPGTTPQPLSSFQAPPVSVVSAPPPVETLPETLSAPPPEQIEAPAPAMVPAVPAPALAPPPAIDFTDDYEQPDSGPPIAAAPGPSPATQTPSLPGEASGALDVAGLFQPDEAMEAKLVIPVYIDGQTNDDWQDTSWGTGWSSSGEELESAGVFTESGNPPYKVAEPGGYGALSLSLEPPENPEATFTAPGAGHVQFGMRGADPTVAVQLENTMQSLLSRRVVVSGPQNNQLDSQYEMLAPNVVKLSNDKFEMVAIPLDMFTQQPKFDGDTDLGNNQWDRINLVNTSPNRTQFAVENLSLIYDTDPFG